MNTETFPVGMGNCIAPMFEPFAKIPRLRRECVITEKIDGTNAQVFVWEGENNPLNVPVLWTDGTRNIAAGSRNRWLTLCNDNYGFAHWVFSNGGQLAHLGPGRHFGEWWGLGIQRTYGAPDKRFSLFNVARWRNPLPPTPAASELGKELPPDCCRVVPVLATGMFDSVYFSAVVGHLRNIGSFAMPGFDKPEGVVIYHTASKQLFKQTLENDDQPKSS